MTSPAEVDLAVAGMGGETGELPLEYTTGDLPDVASGPNTMEPPALADTPLAPKTELF